MIIGAIVLVVYAACLVWFAAESFFTVVVLGKTAPDLLEGDES